MSENKVVQGFEPKPEGGDSIYWMVLDKHGKVVDVFDTEQEALDSTLAPLAPATDAVEETIGERFDKLTEDEQRDLALQGDLYELVGLGLADPSLLAPAIPQPLAEKDERIEKLEKGINKAIAMLDYVTLHNSHAAQLVLKKALAGEDFSSITIPPAMPQLAPTPAQEVTLTEDEKLSGQEIHTCEACEGKGKVLEYLWGRAEPLAVPCEYCDGRGSLIY